MIIVSAVRSVPIVQFVAQGLSYNDALKLLGGSGPLAKAADNVLGGALSVATAGGSDAAISLFDAKTEVVRLGRLVTQKITDLVRGQSRYNRSQRLHAAHSVLVVTAFFETLDTDQSRDDQLAAVASAPGTWIEQLLTATIPAPGPDVPFDALLTRLRDWFTRHADDRIAGAALARYQEHVRALMTEVPEFAIWMRQQEDRAVSRGLEALEATLLRVTSHRDPVRHRAALALTYRAGLGSPVLGGDSGDLTLPSLGTAYLDPRFRVKPGGPGARPAEDGWWDTAVRDDFAELLAVYLTTPQAAVAPMLLLGQPGAGKSALTRILAARLPAADYLVVRVVLREVPAESPIQDQVEAALRSAIGETVAWADLAGDAGGAMPVILLDGFDELLQATGVHQSDYLQRVAEFQQREAVLGRPVAVMVTSRVAVADRARMPAGSLAVRLEPFAEPQLERWVATWNHANAAYWEVTGRRPLTLDVLKRYPDLAGQPLLLLMLAIYDADANALQRDGDELGAGELYERLLHSFAEREVRRIHAGRPDSSLPELIEDELLRLSVVAFAMFHRGRLWVTTAELDNDLAGLGLRPRRETGEGFRSPLTAGQEVVGRFFFIQRAQARQDDQTLQTYEFLHATFGEYLVARLVVQALADAAARAKARTLSLGAGTEDDLLQSLLGYTPLSARATVLPFVAELLTRHPDVGEWLIGRLRVAVTRPAYQPRSYQPIEKRVDYWMSTYSFNLALLVLAAGHEVRASELFRYAKRPATWLRDTALQWRAAVPANMFLEAMKSVGVIRTWTGDGRRDLVLTGTPHEVAPPVEILWSQDYGMVRDSGVTRHDLPLKDALTSMDLSGALSDDLLRHALQPLLDRMPEAVEWVVTDAEGRSVSMAHLLIEVLLASAMEKDPDALRSIRERALTLARSAEFGFLADHLRGPEE
ncbi:hypothetical protein AMIS_58630 [Actinoplanes missouriensis 431]|uniref:NACHT N-terminal Helical domain-containing protein n=1 Tax=Actinoplanes missouriensis (strain ATCC 14538 / DSM 43046 / CBS 188.64 / JCM 3121 / NBRC 102363 / NCIMB 12654 / NRRL B-3342 / UNCC 431) TaxID=512565 RepID=I0HDJ6_ACTM4|nr:hypothetical protein AMIS_58630 [Actinoplanes missouriensis 431]